MSEYYTRSEICNLFSPPVSRNYIICLGDKNRIPKPVKKTEKGYLYDKKQIDEWLSKGVEKEKSGRKAGERQLRMSNKYFDTWNVRKNKQPFKYSGEMVDLIMFLQPNLRNRFIGNSL